MSDQNENNDPLQRLFDMIVEEVSLVDRAANKRRFLIVKRSDEMAENTNSENTNQGEPNAVENTQDSSATTEGNLETTANSNNEEASQSDPISAAIQALETLQNAGAALADMDSEDGKPELEKLAAKFEEVSRLLSVTTQNEEENTSESEPEAVNSDSHDINAESETLNSPAPKSDDSKEAVAAIHSALERLESLMGSVSGISKGRKTETTDAPNKEDDALGKSVRSLIEAVKEQQQRLARVEKRFGLPNSLPSGETPKKTTDNTESWPMDLNSPVDRDNVAKDVSFHDV